MMNLVNFLQAAAQTAGEGGSTLCADLRPVLRIVGIVVLGIKILVPIVLIVVGMIDLAKAVGEKDEGKIKEAQNRLIKRAIAAVLVFLVATFVSAIMVLVGGEEYKDCMYCINNPFNEARCPKKLE